MKKLTQKKIKITDGMEKSLDPRVRKMLGYGTHIRQDKWIDAVMMSRFYENT